MTTIINKTMAPKRKSKASMQQKAITEHALPLLKKPLEAIGKLVGFPGDFWKGRMTEEERKTIYRCAVTNYTYAHKFSPGALPEAAFELQEMGTTGTGSTELGDSSGEVFWVSMQTFLKYYYITFPDEMPKPEGASPTPTTAHNESESVDITDDDPSPKKPDVVAGFPYIRLSRAEVMRYYTVKSDTLIEMGPKSGWYKATFECLIAGCDGCFCGAKREVAHKKGGGVSTSNLITHVRQMAKSCPKHKEALVAIDKANANMIELEGGELVKMYNFSESFTCASAPPVPVAPSPRLVEYEYEKAS